MEENDWDTRELPRSYSPTYHENFLEYLAGGGQSDDSNDQIELDAHIILLQQDLHLYREELVAMSFHLSLIRTVNMLWQLHWGSPSDFDHGIIWDHLVGMIKRFLFKILYLMIFIFTRPALRVIRTLEGGFDLH